MAYRRGYFALTPPSILIFVFSVVFAIAAFLVHYGGVSVPLVPRARTFDVLTIGYVLLLIGVVVRRL